MAVLEEVKLDLYDPVHSASPTIKGSNVKDKKRLQYKSYAPSKMEAAMKAVQTEGKTMYRAAKDFGVPMNTLRDRLIASGIFKPRHVYKQKCASTKCGQLAKQVADERAKPDVIIDDDIIERWQDIGKAEGLASNAAISRFLISMYYAGGKLEEAKPDTRCQECHKPLALFCVSCKRLTPCSPHRAADASHPADHRPGVEPADQRPAMSTADHMRSAADHQLGVTPADPSMISADDSMTGTDQGSRVQSGTSSHHTTASPTHHASSPHHQATPVQQHSSAPSPQQQAEVKTEEETPSSRAIVRGRRLRSRGKMKKPTAAEDRCSGEEARAADGLPSRRGERSCQRKKKPPAVEVSESEDQCDMQEDTAGEDWSDWRLQDVQHREDSAHAVDDLLAQLVGQACGQDQHVGQACGQEQLVGQDCSESGLPLSQCGQCGQCFEGPAILQQHLTDTGHRAEYTCRQCHKTFKTKSALQQHGRVHRHQDHQCPTCGLSFKFPSRLNKHLKTHGSDRPHVCDKCGKCFVSVYYLRDHIKIHSDDRPYKCDLCGAAFKQRPALYAHGKKHTNEKSFQCHYCGLKFRDSQKVKIHVRTHTGEKPYQCDLCDARFVSNSNMWQHCAYVHGKSTKTHHCPHCPLTFAAKGKLKVHLKKSHSPGDGQPETCHYDAVRQPGQVPSDSCQFQVMRQAVQPFYIEIPGNSQLVSL